MSDSNSTAAEAGTKAPPPGFWSSVPFFGNKYGMFHQADVESRHFFPGVLLVFIHGIYSNATVCWNDLPHQLLTRLRFDADILNFQYPAGFCSNISVPEAAAQLEGLLSSLIKQSRYKDILFAVHSAGGLVLKQMLVTDSGNSNEIFSRTRQIFNFGVPHHGSQKGYSEFGRKVVVLAEILLYPVTSFIRFASQGAIGCGRNRIMCELKHDGKFVTALERQYVDIINTLDEAATSRPESLEISAGNDTVSDSGARPLGTQIRVREIHTSLQSSPIAIKAVLQRNVLETLWNQRRAECDLTVAQLMVERVTVIEEATGTDRIIDEQEKDGLDQAECLAQLRRLLADRARKRLLVSGPVGVGKSVVLRRLCKEECRRFLDPGGNQRGTLVLFFPIDRLTLEGSAKDCEGAGLQLALCRAWVKQANAISKELTPGAPAPITLSWLLARLQTDATVVILDGVDEFIANHPQVTIEAFTRTLPSGNDDPSQRDVRVVMGARESLWGLEKLRIGSVHLRLSPLGKGTVARLVPDLAAMIDQMSDADQQMLSTPLVVNALSNAGHSPRQHSAIKIIQEAVESLLEAKRFFERGFTLEQLALVVWIYYRRFRRELSVGEIIDEAQKIVADWERDASELAAEGRSPPALCSCLEHLKQVSNLESLRALLQQVFFFPTKAASYSLSNEGWRDFFVTFYLSLCVRHNHASGLGGIAFQVEHYKRAGDLLEDFRVDESLVSSFVSRAQLHQDPFIVGNLASVLGVSDVSMLAAASRRAAQACGQDMHPLGRFVATSRLAGRAVRRHPVRYDPSAPDILYGLRQALPDILSRPDCDSVMRSLCLCCLWELGIQGEAPIPLDPEEALHWIRDDSSESSERARSIQMSFLSAQYTTKEFPERSIAHIHYLYLLTAARVKGWAIPEVSEQLPVFLEPGSETELHYKSYISVPELYRIYGECQRIWQEFNGPLPLAFGAMSGE